MSHTECRMMSTRPKSNGSNADQLHKIEKAMKNYSIKAYMDFPKQTGYRKVILVWTVNALSLIHI